MRIAIVTVSFPPDNEKSPFPASYELAKALHRAGHQVLVLTLTQGESRREKHEGIDVYRQKIDLEQYQGLKFSTAMAFPNCIPQALELFGNSQAILEEFQPDVIEAQEFNGLGLFFGLQRRFPFVVRVYGPLAHLLRSGTIGSFSAVDMEIVHSLEIGTVGCADALITLCRDMAGQMGNWAGIDPASFTVLPTPMAPTPENEPFVPPTDSVFPRLMYWGRIQRQKGIDLLVEALPQIAAKYPNFRLTISGAECVEAGASEPYANVMRRRIAELGLTKNVEYVGFLSVEQIRKQVATTDICVFPSRYETACYAAMEAAMYGGCVLATKVGGLPDHIADGVSGYLVEPESPDALAKGVIALCDNDELRARLRTGARADVIQRSDPDRNAARSVEVYQRAIENFRSAQRSGSPTVPKIVEALMTGLKTVPPTDRLHEMLCEKYTEGAKAGYEQGLADGLRQQPAVKRSIVNRIARKVVSLAQRS